jgi:sortase A
MLAGVGTLGWAVLVWQWQDPFTAAYTTYEQHQLKSRYHRLYAAYKPVSSVPAANRPAYRHLKGRDETGPSLAAQKHQILVDARAYRAKLREGDPLGRLKVPRLGLNIIAVNGTEAGSLEKGPGRYSGPLSSYVPGEGQLIYVAGHRTTYLAPFSRIDRLRPGDTISFELPYATFHYVVTGHVIVPADDFAVLHSHNREILALQACHPRFFATHRYIAYAKLVRVEPRYGPAYGLDGSRLVTATA